MSTSVQPTETAEKPRKKRRIFLWFFLAIQVLFLVWIFAGVGGSEATDCGTLSKKACQDATDIGTGLGVALILVFWCIVDFLLAVGYVIYRLARRP